jgi:hypothetical protein
MDKFRVIITPILFLVSLIFLAGAQVGAADSSKILISFKSHGGPCFSVCLDEKDRSCCPIYSFTIRGDGTVNYEGLAGVKVRGKQAHSIPAMRVEELVAEFEKIGFFSLENEYDDHRIDHYNAITISLTIDGRTKSIYVAHGQPKALDILLRKVVEVSGVEQYLGRS